MQNFWVASKVADTRTGLLQVADTRTGLLQMAVAKHRGCGRSPLRGIQIVLFHEVVQDAPFPFFLFLNIVCWFPLPQTPIQLSWHSTGIFVVLDNYGPAFAYPIRPNPSALYMFLGQEFLCCLHLSGETMLAR